MHKCVGVRFADFISFYFNIPLKSNNLVTETKLFHFHGYLKTVGVAGRGFERGRCTDLGSTAWMHRLV